MEAQYTFLRTVAHEAKTTRGLSKKCLAHIDSPKNKWVRREDFETDAPLFLDLVKRVYAFGNTFKYTDKMEYLSLMHSLSSYGSTVLYEWCRFPWHQALSAAGLAAMNGWLYTQYTAVLALFKEAFEDIQATVQLKSGKTSSLTQKDRYEQLWIAFLYPRLRYAFDSYIGLFISALSIEEKAMRIIQKPLPSNTHLIQKLKTHVGQSTIFEEVGKRKVKEVTQLFQTNADITVQSLKAVLYPSDPFIYSLMKEKKQWEKEQSDQASVYSSQKRVAQEYFILRRQAIEALYTLVENTPFKKQTQSVVLGTLRLGEWLEHPQTKPFADHLLLLLIDSIDSSFFKPYVMLWHKALRNTLPILPLRNKYLERSINTLLAHDIDRLASSTVTAIQGIHSSWEAAYKAHEQGKSVKVYLEQHARRVLSRKPVKRLLDVSLPLYASFSSRQRHAYILGRSGSGKTELLKHLIHEDIQAGYGLFILDPHGDLAQECMRFKLFEQPAYKDRLVYISPEFLEQGFLPQYNPFEYAPEGKTIFEQRNALSVRAKELAMSLESFFGNDFTSNMKLLLTNCIKLLLEAPDVHLGHLVELLYPNGNGTAPYEALLASYHDTALRDYFEHLFPASRLDLAKMAIITRLNEATSNQFFKHMLYAPTSSFNFRSLLKAGKIIIVNASQAKLSRDGTRILGSLLSAELTIMAMSRAALPTAQRTPIFAYIDECQNFLSESIDKLLTEGRKYGVHLVMANQFLGQFDGTPRLKQSILANTAIKLCGSASVKDQTALAKEVKFTFSSDLQLGKGRFVCGMEGYKGIVLQTPHKLLPPLSGNPFYSVPAQVELLRAAQWKSYYASIDPYTGTMGTPSPPTAPPSGTFVPEIDDL
jgi:hypothetical protein